MKTYTNSQPELLKVHICFSAPWLCSVLFNCFSTRSSRCWSAEGPVLSRRRLLLCCVELYAVELLPPFMLLEFMLSKVYVQDDAL